MASRKPARKKPSRISAAPTVPRPSAERVDAAPSTSEATRDLGAPASASSVDHAETGDHGGSNAGGRGGAIDRCLSELRFHHLFNAVTMGLLAALIFRAPQLSILPFYLALVARIPALALQRRFSLSHVQSALSVAAIAFLTLIATAIFVFLPVVLQAAQFDKESLQQLRPIAQDISNWARDLLISLGVDPLEIEEVAPLTPEAVLETVSKSVGDSAGMALRASGLLLQPVLLVALSLLVVFMASYALAASPSLKREARRFLRVCWPPRTVAIVERWTLHAQHFGAEVFRGYSWMVLVLGFFYFLAYLGAIALFEEAPKLPPVIVVALVTLTAMIGAIPGLGAKLLLVVGTLLGLGVAAAAYVFTGNIWLGVYIFAAFVIVTGFESKFGTPSTLGRALGVNSCLMLFLAIATVAGFGVNATLWTVFVILPIIVGAMRVMVEIYGDRPETEAPIPPLRQQGP